MGRIFLTLFIIIGPIWAAAQCKPEYAHHIHNVLNANSKQPKVEQALIELGWVKNEKWLEPPKSWGMQNVIYDVDDKGVLFLLGFTVPKGGDMDAMIKYFQDTLMYEIKMNTSRYKELAMPGYKLTVDIYPQPDGSFKWQFSRPERTFSTWTR